MNTYAGLLFDEYPGFIDDAGKTPVQYNLDYDEPVNRLTAGLRFIWAIPALFIAIVLAFAVFFVTVVTWFTILITGKHPRGQFDFQLKVNRYTMQTNAYVGLLTDDYPQYASRHLDAHLRSSETPAIRHRRPVACRGGRRAVHRGLATVVRRSQGHLRG